MDLLVFSRDEILIRLFSSFKTLIVVPRRNIIFLFVQNWIFLLVFRNPKQTPGGTMLITLIDHWLWSWWSWQMDQVVFVSDKAHESTKTTTMSNQARIVHHVQVKPVHSELFLYSMEAAQTFRMRCNAVIPTRIYISMKLFPTSQVVLS
jgi:hypothetical protein